MTSYLTRIAKLICFLIRQLLIPVIHQNLIYAKDNRYTITLITPKRII